MAGIVLSLFLIFGDFEPRCSDKIVLIKKECRLGKMIFLQPSLATFLHKYLLIFPIIFRPRTKLEEFRYINNTSSYTYNTQTEGKIDHL